MNVCNYIVFDFETTGLVDAYPIEIAAQAYDARSLELIGTFPGTLCKPPDDVVIHEQALQKNQIKREDIAKAPLLEVVWPKFVDWVSKFAKGKKNWDAPIPCGHNIDGFDLPISRRMNELFGPKKQDTVLWHTNQSIDSNKVLYQWFENSTDLTKFNLDAIRDYMGITKDGAHRAMKDVEDSAAIIMRFLKFQRRLLASGKIQFRNCFKA